MKEQRMPDETRKGQAGGGRAEARRADGARASSPVGEPAAVQKDTQRRAASASSADQVSAEELKQSIGARRDEERGEVF
jgi:hypothetical protein